MCQTIFLLKAILFHFNVIVIKTLNDNYVSHIVSCRDNCHNGGICGQSAGVRFCQCKPGTSGDLCERVDDCNENSCGIKTDVKCHYDVKKERAICKCFDLNKLFDSNSKKCRDPCSNNCHNNGECFGSGDDKFCRCQPGTSGDFCNTVDDCANDHLCGSKEDVICVYDKIRKRASCECYDTKKSFDFKTKECQRDKCGDHKCHNGGVCIDDHDESPRCCCKPPFSGERCEKRVDHCSSYPCQNGGRCKNQNYDYECTCTGNYKGKDCSENGWCDMYGQDLCHKEKCQYDENIGRGYCVCRNSGVFHNATKTCSVDHCASNPCHNGGSCRSGHNTFECTCIGFYGGKDCSENAWCQKYGQYLCGKEMCQYNETIGRGYCFCENGKIFHEPSKTCMGGVCHSYDCHNGGICKEEGGSAKCYCRSPFSGERCEKEGSCLAYICHNGGVCKDKGDGPICYCKQPFSGERCERVPDPCDPSPCKNNGHCANEDGKYKCFCKDGYTGDECEKVPDPCSPNPCKNNGYCANEDGKYSCFCIDGYTGDKCETVPDSCYPNPCKNNGQCENDDGKYKCFCKDGYTGDECEKVPDPCYPNPCKNNGYCANEDGKYKCFCKDGYTGDECKNT